MAHATSVNIAGCTGDPSCTPLASENSLAAALGVGFDVKLTHHIALRLIEGDFLLTNFRDPFAANVQKWQKNVRLSSGLVVRFGGNPPPPQRVAMSASCSADREMVYADSGDVIAVHVRAATSEKYPVNYSWSASDGAVDGTGADVRWSSAGHHTGPYTVKVRVDNGRNGSAECFANLRVEQRPNRPPVIACSADRSTVTQGEPVTITANASDPDNDPLTYSWSASSGKIDGSESSAKFRTGDLSPGPYTVSGHVDDGRSGTADCSVIVQVEAVRVPAEVVELEHRLALHSIYFQTARPRVGQSHRRPRRKSGKRPSDPQQRLQSLSDLQTTSASDPAGTRRSSRYTRIQQGTDRAPRGAHQQLSSPHMEFRQPTSKHERSARKTT